MSTISWGKPRLIAKKLGGSGTWLELPTPVQDSTELTTTKGEKKEAKIEGGENEDVKYERNTYSLAASIRAAKDRKKPFDDADGVIDGNYAFVLIPEDPTNRGFVFRKSVISAADSFTAADGGVWEYVVDAIKDGAHDQITWGVITVTETSGSISKVECTPENSESKFEVGANAPE